MCIWDRLTARATGLQFRDNMAKISIDLSTKPMLTTTGMNPPRLHEYYMTATLGVQFAAHDDCYEVELARAKERLAYFLFEGAFAKLHGIRAAASYGDRDALQNACDALEREMLGKETTCEVGR